MSTTTYKIRFDGKLSGKRFQDALKLVKDAGGTYDKPSKTWTVTAEDETFSTRTCSTCGGTGHLVLNAASPAGQECPGSCAQHGPHKHAAGPCPECQGGGTKTYPKTPRALNLLRQAEYAYGATVTPAEDSGRAALEAERDQLKARLAEIDAILAADA